LVVVGALAALIPNLPVIKLLLGVQTLNGVLPPAVLLFILRLINDERLTSGLKNTTAYNLLGWGTFALAPSAVVMMMGTQLLRLLGVNVF
jgi:Mn2+/Fe2+ NRAMP family transporter